MELNEYQKLAMTTCMKSSENFSYMFLNLVGEVGEFASKVAKAIRKEKAVVAYNGLSLYNTTQEEIADLRKEAGDIAWQLAGLCSVMGWTLEEVCAENLLKLQQRKVCGTIDGSGDGVTKEERR